MYGMLLLFLIYGKFNEKINRFLFYNQKKTKKLNETKS